MRSGLATPPPPSYLPYHLTLLSPYHLDPLPPAPYPALALSLLYPYPTSGRAFISIPFPQSKSVWNFLIPNASHSGPSTLPAGPTSTSPAPPVAPLSGLKLTGPPLKLALRVRTSNDGICIEGVHAWNRLCFVSPLQSQEGAASSQDQG